jgi:hypothetical protein
MLIGAGFPGDFSTALKRGAIKQLEQDGRYVWIAKVVPDSVPANATATDRSEECATTIIMAGQRQLRWPVFNRGRNRGVVRAR